MAPSTGFIPINDLKEGTFNGWKGGLYPNGSNFIPKAHKTAGMKIAADEIYPRNSSGEKDLVNGKIVWLSVGMSNATAEAKQFILLANAYPNKNPRLVFIDGAVGGMTTSIISTPNHPNYATYWNTVSGRLSAAGVTASQVQVIWYKEANVANGIPIMNYYDSLVIQTKRVMNILKQRFPFAGICYMASRISARYASSALNPEPYAYYTGWAVKKVIEDQIMGDPKLKFDGQGANSPWLSWGIYMWSDGDIPQATNPKVFWTCPADFQNDGTHPSNPAGTMKVAELLLSFYEKDTLSCPWLFKNPPSFCASLSSADDNPVLEDGITVYPIPAVNIIHIRTPWTSFICTLYNPQGQIVYQCRNTNEINVSLITEGLYILTLTHGSGRIHVRKLNIIKNSGQKLISAFK